MITFQGFESFRELFRTMVADIMEFGNPVDTGQWQSQSSDKMTKTIELPFVGLSHPIPWHHQGLIDEVQPNLPWAEDHFQERVSGIPHNPPPSAAWWPYKQQGHEEHTDDQGKFSHTYPERLWPSITYGDQTDRITDKGNLDDLVNLLRDHRGTRQAFIPIWWPCDGAMAGKERVPCTLGYHFMVRADLIHCLYPMRSCDLLRHFIDDFYMAARLMQWVGEQISRSKEGYSMRPVRPGSLNMVISSLHIFEGDLPMLRLRQKQGQL